MNADTKQNIENIITDTVINLLYYDRKGCEVIPVGEIERLIKLGDISIDWMVDTFKQELNGVIGE